MVIFITLVLVGDVLGERWMVNVRQINVGHVDVPSWPKYGAPNTTRPVAKQGFVSFHAIIIQFKHFIHFKIETTWSCIGQFPQIITWKVMFAGNNSHSPSWRCPRWTVDDERSPNQCWPCWCSILSQIWSAPKHFCVRFDKRFQGKMPVELPSFSFQISVG